MKTHNITKKTSFLVITTLTISLFTACGSASPLTGDKIINQGNGHLTVQSNVEMTDTNINSEIPGKITEVKIKEGDTVKKGQILIVMDSDVLVAQQSQVEAQIDSANAQLNAAKAARDAASAKLEEARNGARPEEIGQAKAAYDLAQLTYNRVKTLYDEGASPESDLDNASTQLQLAKDKYIITKDGVRPEEIEAAQAQVNQAAASVQAVEGQIKQAKAALQGVNVNLNYATLKAPTDGVITQLNVEAGELVTTGMALSVVTDISAASILCNVDETDLSKVKMNQEVSIKIPTYKDQSFMGKVVRINKNADFATKKATNDNGEFDILTYGVKVELTNPSIPLRAGMTAFVDFGK